MAHFKSFVFSKSRSRSFLWKLCIGTVLFGFALGFFLSYFNFESEVGLRAKIETRLLSDNSGMTTVVEIPNRMTEVVLEVLEEDLVAGDLAIEDLLIEIPSLQAWIRSTQYRDFETLFQRYLPEADSEMAVLFLRSYGDEAEIAKARLLELAGQTPIRRYANQVLGLIATQAELYNSAYGHYLKEGEIPEAQWAREQVVVNRHHVNDFETLKSLANNPLYNSAFSPWIQAELAIDDRDWLNSVKWIILSQLAGIQMGSFILATIAMVVWATILLQLCQISHFDKFTPLLCLLALLLGILSITPTLFWIMLEDTFLPISSGEDLFHNIVYYIATVGLREEFCKLLLLLPLVPILVKRGNQMEFLLVASFVGLGFAYEENLNYLASTMGTATTARFLTANFLHISLTGMSGLFFCRMWRVKTYSYNDFLFIFGVAIIAHGLYDALLSSPEMNDGGMLAMILFVLFSRFYFREANALQEIAKPLVSLSATMAVGVSLILASMLVYLSIVLNTSSAFQLTFGSFLGSAIILFMFFREFNETLHD